MRWRSGRCPCSGLISWSRSRELTKQTCTRTQSGNSFETGKTFFQTSWLTTTSTLISTSVFYVSGSYFRGLGVSPVFGRVLEPSDDQPGAPPVCVLGYRLWRQLYSQSRNILGRTILVNGNEFQIVGVAPPSFFGVDIGHVPEIFMPFEA